ncbi:MAG: hypothetical protein ACJ8BW_17390, partial [Ktedonobacteraceae bacterium]
AAHACPHTMFIIDDEHERLLFLSICLSPTRVVGDLREKYTHPVPRDCPFRRSVLPQRTSATIRTPGLEQVSITIALFV